MAKQFKKNQKGNWISEEDKTSSGDGIETMSLSITDLINILIAKGLISDADIKP